MQEQTDVYTSSDLFSSLIYFPSESTSLTTTFPLASEDEDMPLEVSLNSLAGSDNVTLFLLTPRIGVPGDELTALRLSL